MAAKGKNPLGLFTDPGNFCPLENTHLDAYHREVAGTDRKRRTNYYGGFK